MTKEPPIVVLLGLPFHDITLEEVLAECREMMVHGSQPRYLVTPNVDFTTQANEDLDLRKIVYFADRVVCDGMPLVWLSKIFGTPLRERVAGSDIVPRLLAICAQEKLPVYFFGSDMKTLEEAGRIAAERYPGFVVAGCDAPPIGAVVEWDNDAICAKMKASGAKLLLVCLGCPKQERWIFAHHRDTGIPLSIGVGASLDFISGKQKRAPKWMQKTGLEWFWRMAGDPKRLVSRYAADLSFLIKATLEQRRLASKREALERASVQVNPTDPDVLRVCWSGALEKGSYHGAPVPQHIDRPVLLDAATISFMDSGGLGRLAALLRNCRAVSQPLFLVGPSAFVRQALAAARMDTLVDVVEEESAALTRLAADITTRVAAGPQGIVEVAFTHSLDAIHLDAITRALEEAEPAAASALIVDLAAVDFIDSRAVGVLIRFHKRMLAKGGALHLHRPSPSVREILKLLRLEKILSEWKEAA